MDRSNGKKIAQTIAVFENVGFFSGMVLFRHLLQGHTVRYFYCSSPLEKKGYLKKYFEDGRLKRIIPGEIELVSQTKLNNEVLDSVDQVYNDHFADKNFVRHAENSLESPYVNAAFRKELSLKMLEKFQIFQRLDSLSGNFMNPVFYYPEDTFYKAPYNYSKIRDLIKSRKILIPFTGEMFAVLSDVREKIYWLLLFAAFPFWILLQSGFLGDPVGKKKDFLLGIRIYDNDFGFTPKYRSIDFLVNEECPFTDDTLFCIETDISDKYREQFKEKGYHVVEIRKILKTSGIFSVGAYVLSNIVPIWIKSLPSLVSQRPFIVKLFMEIQHKKLLWTTFLKNYSLNHYVTYNDTMAGDTIRNILFDKSGTESWYFIHSIDNFDHYTPKTEGKLFREVLYSFLCYDHLVVWGDNSEEYYRSCPNDIRHYDKLGCLWSEHVSFVQQHPETNEVLVSVQKHFLAATGTMPKKCIGVYDTTAGGAQMPLQLEDIRAFVDGIVLILETFPEVGVIFKMKNPVEFAQLHFREIVEIYQKLIRHPRCYTATSAQSDPSEVTAISDLVVSACFTSVTVEALGARKRAIYYDATGKFRNLYFDRFPRFVAHSTDELLELVLYWLYENSEQEFNTFLETYIKGELESYLDGKAITRFRERICG